MPRKKRLASEASLMLAEYEAINTDIPREVRRQLAVFVLATKIGGDSLDKLFARPMGQTPFRHRSWMWYTAMATSDLGHYWDEFAGQHNQGVPMRDCLIGLRDHATPKQWECLSRRLGIPVFKDGSLTINPHWWNSKGSTRKIWTRGGVWSRANKLTKIIVLGETLDGQRDHTFSQITRALSLNECKLIEREVCNVVDEEVLLYPDAIHAAIAYVRARIPIILGLKRSYTSYRVVSWFFQTKIPQESKGWVNYTDNYQKPKRQSRSRNDPYWIDWLPPIERLPNATDSRTTQRNADPERSRFSWMPSP